MAIKYPSDAVGGVASATTGLIRSLGKLDGPEEYVIVGVREDIDRLRPYLGPNQFLVCDPLGARSYVGRLRSLSNRLRERGGRTVREAGKHPLPVSNGVYERLGSHVVHFPTNQGFVASKLPTVYNPHDLQHVHLPEFFTPETLMWREAYYPAACRLAHAVVVESGWVKDDIVKHFGLDPAKIQVIPLAPPTEGYPEPSADDATRVQRAYRLEQPFAFYPAVTWQHKNHLRLLEGLALLRDRFDVRVRLVCTGHQNAFWPQIQRRLDEWRLHAQVTFLGMIQAKDLRALYRLAQFVVIPTLFEAASEPIYEAWLDGAPVACSNVTSLPAQVGDAALIFDPQSVESIAAALRAMVTDANLRETLRQRGTRRLRDFSWDRTAKAYRAVYRRAAGRVLTEEDRWLLTWDWMRDAKAEQPSVPRAG